MEDSRGLIRNLTKTIGAHRRISVFRSYNNNTPVSLSYKNDTTVAQQQNTHEPIIFINLVIKVESAVHRPIKDIRGLIEVVTWCFVNKSRTNTNENQREAQRRIENSSKMVGVKRLITRKTTINWK